MRCRLPCCSVLASRATALLAGWLLLLPSVGYGRYRFGSSRLCAKLDCNSNSSSYAQQREQQLQHSGNRHSKYGGGCNCAAAAAA